MLEGDEVVGAFADDIGVVLKHFRKALPKLRALFDKFGFASGLTLNLAKCDIVPLGATDDKGSSQGGPPASKNKRYLGRGFTQTPQD